MTKTEKPKTDIWRWLSAIVLPKKGKPVTQPDPEWMPKAAPTPTAQPGAPVTPVKLEPVPAAKPAVTPTPVSHSAPVAAAPAVKPASPPSATPPAPVKKETAASPRKPLFDKERTLRAVWTVGSVLSLVVNIILVLVLIILGRELFALKALVGNQLLGGLYENFIYMDQAHIKSQITVADNIPINFTLPISQDTVVTLTENTPINGAMVRINSGGLTINSAANIVLPAGTNLPVHLQLDVPVNTTVPIKLNVPVDIPLDQTELHRPFIGLQQVVAPFYHLLQPQIKGPQDLWLCKPFFLFCTVFFQQ